MKRVGKDIIIEAEIYPPTTNNNDGVDCADNDIDGVYIDGTDGQRDRQIKWLFQMCKLHLKYITIIISL